MHIYYFGIRSDWRGESVESSTVIRTIYMCDDWKQGVYGQCHRRREKEEDLFHRWWGGAGQGGGGEGEGELKYLKTPTN